MPMFSMVGKALGGAGAGGGGAAAAAAPSPWSGAITGQPPQAPPTPEQNPLFASDRDLFGGAGLIPGKPAGSGVVPPMPAMKGNALFDEQMQKKPGAPAMPIPSRKPQSPDDMAQGIGGGEYGMFLDAQAQQDEEDAVTKSLPGMFGATQTAAKTAPINSTDTRNNTERLSQDGWTLDSGVGQVIPKTGQPAAGGLFAPPMPARKPVANGQLTQGEAAAGYGQAPKLDRGLFDPPTKVQAVPGQTLSGGTGSPDVEGEDEGNGYESGMGLLPKSVGEPLGQFQDALGDGATNPLFQLGMGIMSGGYDGSNPWKQALAGINNIPAQQLAAQGGDMQLAANERANKDQSRQDQEMLLKLQEQDRMRKLIEALTGAGAQAPGSNVARGAAKTIR